METDVQKQVYQHIPAGLLAPPLHYTFATISVPWLFRWGYRHFLKARMKQEQVKEGPYSYIFFLSSYISYPHIFDLSIHIHTPPIYSKLFKTAQNLRILKELTWSWHSLDLICPSFVSEAGVPVVFFALAPPVLALEAPVLVIFVGKTHSQGDAQHGGCFDVSLSTRSTTSETRSISSNHHCIVRLECKQLFHAVLMHYIQVPIVGIAGERRQ